MNSQLLDRRFCVQRFFKHGAGAQTITTGVEGTIIGNGGPFCWNRVVTPITTLLAEALFLRGGGDTILRSTVPTTKYLTRDGTADNKRNQQKMECFHEHRLYFMLPGVEEQRLSANLANLTEGNLENS